MMHWSRLPLFVLSCNIFYVNACPLRFEGIENNSWLGNICYIQICIYSRIKSFIPSCISAKLLCTWPSCLASLADNTFEGMKRSLM